MVTIKDFNIFADATALFVLILIHISMLLDTPEKRRMSSFKLSLYCSCFYCALDMVFQLINGNAAFTVLNYIIACLSFLLSYVMVFLISDYLFEVISLSPNIHKRLIKIYAIVGVFWVTVLLTLSARGYFFTFIGGYYSRGDYWHFTVTYPLICMLADCLIILFTENPTRIKVTFAAFCIVPAIGVIVAYFTDGISAVSVLLMISALILYLNIYVERSIELQIKESELKAAQTESMVAQIQPHFLYNCITTCVALCRFAPERAADMMQNFGKYLRGNLNAFKQKEPVPFVDELAHIKVYLKLEKERFDKKLKIRYNISVTEFNVPALSIQPIVENAVKHGISKSEKDGTVTISTWEDDNSFFIEIADDGRGFDVNAPINDGATHIGLDNSRRRLEMLVGATLSIESEIGKGTTALITIPKQNDLR